MEFRKLQRDMRVRIKRWSDLIERFEHKWDDRRNDEYVVTPLGRFYRERNSICYTVWAIRDWSKDGRVRLYKGETRGWKGTLEDDNYVIHSQMLDDIGYIQLAGAPLFEWIHKECKKDSPKYVVRRKRAAKAIPKKPVVRVTAAKPRAVPARRRA